MTVNTQLKPVAILLLCISIIMHTAIMAQVSPANRSVLNYRLIGFTVPEQEGVSSYEFVVNEYIITDTGSSFEKPIFKKKSNTNKLAGTVPYWGKSYTWKVNYYTDAKQIGSSETYRFATGYSPFVDTSKYRLRVIENKVKNANMYVFVDGLKAMFDMNGTPVWYLPNIDGEVEESTRIRDLKITNKNTITFLTEKQAFEINYNGMVVWSAPNDGKVSGDTIEHYHHQFTRLKKGNYMIAGTDTSTREITNISDTSIYTFEADVFKLNGRYYKNIPSGTLIEYDDEKNIVWKWRSSEYFNDADLFTKISASGTVNTSTHMNCFYFDEINNHIYIGFRDINRIVKISYPDGKVLAEYGENYTNDNDIIGPDLFKAHHNNILNTDNNILLYNNNVHVRSGKLDVKYSKSSILILKQPDQNSKVLSKVWEFYCDFDSLADHYTLTGGSVAELINKDILVSMGSIHRNFIVTPKKTIQWNSLTEILDQNKNWKPYSSYKISCIESIDILHNLIYSDNYKDH